MDCGKMIGVIAAMPEEAALIAHAMTDISHFEKAGRDFITGKIFGRDVTLVVSGIGKVNAAACAQMLIDCYGVTALVNSGVAGALAPDLKVGDVVIARDAVQYDVDVTVDGYKLGEVPNMDRLAFAADAALVEKAERAAKALDITAKTGRVLTADRVMFDAKMKRAVAAHFDGVCCDMEGAAIAQVAAQNGVAFIEIRAMSDMADGNVKAAFANNYETAVTKASAVTLGLIRLMDE